ncbi:MAG: hypothetical protein ACXWHC_06315, partial [Usitatibacter sp.]
RYEYEVERLGVAAMENHIVHYAVSAARAGHLSWGDAMTEAVKALAAQNKVLMDAVLKGAALHPGPIYIMPKEVWPDHGAPQMRDATEGSARTSR